MSHGQCVDSVCWYLATDGASAWHYGKILPGQRIDTGLPSLVFFNSEEEMISGVVAAGGVYVDPASLETL